MARLLRVYCFWMVVAFNIFSLQADTPERGQAFLGDKPEACAKVNEKPQVCVLLGYPGAGKGTLAQSLDLEKYPQLSFGDILRSELKTGSALGLMYRDEIEMVKIEKIQFLPEEVIRNLLRAHLEAMIKKTGRLILDGYPKTVEQAMYLEKYLESLGVFALIVFVNAEKTRLVERVQGRLTCSNCSRVYNCVARPPRELGLCDVCNGALFIRGSDARENQMKRIQFYDETSSPLIEFYREKKILHEIDNNNSLLEGCARFYEVLLSEGFIREFE
jgi:adenylate kinase